MNTSVSAVATSWRPRRPSDPIPSAEPEREDSEPDERVDPDQAGGGGAGERAVGDGVGDERRAAQDDEEADGAADDRDDRRDDPGVDHEPGEHRLFSAPRRRAGMIREAR